jgi:hypothetical protein
MKEDKFPQQKRRRGVDLVQEDGCGTLRAEIRECNRVRGGIADFLLLFRRTHRASCAQHATHKIFCCFMNRLACGIHADSIKSSIFTVTKTKFNSTT